jgi:predicted Kef-type K+ transport protein
MGAATAIVLAFVLGLVFHQLRLPSLVGYLLAGFLLQAGGMQGGPLLDEVAHVGVLLLLFTLGLKLRLKSLIRPETWGAGLLHLGITTLLFGLLLHRGVAQSWQTGLLLAAVLGFSSTVLAAKVLEERREVRAFHGRTAIGILIFQDLVAIGLLAMLDARPPDYTMLLVLALPLLRPLLHRVMDYIGHDELFILYGLLLAVVLGGLGFERIGLSAELGALLTGTLLAGHPRAVEMSGALWGFKELFLVGFFLQIGLAGTPTLAAFASACVLTLGLVVQAGLFFLILVLFRLRARSAFLAALSLATYSEFGLIVAKLGVERGWLDEGWLVTLAIAVALSFALAAPVNRISHRLFARLEPLLRRFELRRGHPDEQPISLGKSQVLVMGMGRVGSGAYDFFSEHGMRVVGLDSDPGKVEHNLKKGRRVLYADAEDPSLWHTLDIAGIRSIVLAMPDFEAKRIATRQLRRRGFRGFISATSNFPEEAEALLHAGANHTANSFYEVGAGLASNIVEQLRVSPPEQPNPLP